MQQTWSRVSNHLLIVKYFSFFLNGVKQEIFWQELLTSFSVKSIAVMYVLLLVTGCFVIAQPSSVYTCMSSTVSIGHALT